MNRLCRLLNIELPIISGGMVWCSGWRLASAVKNNEDWDDWCRIYASGHTWALP